MDQAWYPSQLLWLAISFGLLFAIVSLFIAPRAESILKTREAAIADAIVEAEKAKQAAETTRSDFEAGGQSARTKAAEMLAKAQAQNTAEANEATAKLAQELDRKTAQAEARIAEARTKALGGMQDATADLAAAMASKLLGRPVTAKEASASTNLKKAS